MKLSVEILRFIEEQEQTWLPYEACLTPEERQWVAGGHVASINRPFVPGWTVDDWLEVASNLQIQVTDVRWSRGLCRTAFRIQDFRVNLVRRVPQIHDPPRLDEHGTPVAHSREAIEDARIDGNYTAAEALAVTDCGEAPTDAELQRDRLKREVDMRNALGQGLGRRREDLLRYERRLEDARKKGRKSTIRVLERKVARVSSVVNKAA